MFTKSFEKTAISIRWIESKINSGAHKRIRDAYNKRVQTGRAGSITNNWGRQGSHLFLNARAKFSDTAQKMVDAAVLQKAHDFNFRDLPKKDRTLYRKLLRGRQLLHPKASKLPITAEEVRSGKKKLVTWLGTRPSSLKRKPEAK